MQIPIGEVFAHETYDGIRGRDILLHRRTINIADRYGLHASSISQWVWSLNDEQQAFMLAMDEADLENVVFEYIEHSCYR